MSDLRKLINLRVKGEDDAKSCEQYFKVIRSLINEVYKYRYSSFLLPYEAVASRKNDKFDISEVNDNTVNHKMADLSEFHSRCWKRLEDKEENIAEKFCDTMSDDRVDSECRSIRNYIKRMFERELQDMIDKLNPEFRSRKKQIERVLSNSSIFQMCEKGHLKIYQLKGSDCSKAELATVNELNEAVADVKDIPRQIFSKKADSKRGPRIMDEDMEAFLEKFLQNSGKFVSFNDLLEMIKQIYGLKRTTASLDEKPGNRNNDFEGDNNDDETLLDILSDSKDEILLCGIDYEKTADRIIHSFDDRLKSIYYHRIADKKNLRTVEEIMNLSPSSISNYEKKMAKIIGDHLISNGFSAEESEYILELVTQKISKSES